MSWLIKPRKGWAVEPPAKIHPRILFGPGIYLSPGFVKMHKITHVINCAFDKDSPSWFRQKNPQNYICLEAIDSLSEDIMKWYPLFEETINKYLEDPDCEKIYVHCQCGMNRSGFMVLLFACKKFGFPFETVRRVILNQRPCALTNKTFEKQVALILHNKDNERSRLELTLV
jgi:protein-tyrosine phosphatase